MCVTFYHPAEFFTALVRRFALAKLPYVIIYQFPPAKPPECVGTYPSCQVSHLLDQTSPSFLFLLSLLHMKFLASWPLGCGVDIFYAKCLCLCLRSLFLPVQYFVISQFFLFSGFFFFTPLYSALEIGCAAFILSFSGNLLFFKTAVLVLDSLPFPSSLPSSLNSPSPNINPHSLR